MSAERVEGTLEQRRYHRTTVLWPATLLCRNNSFACVIFNISASGAKVMIKNTLEMKMPVIISSTRFGDVAGEIVWQNPSALGVRFLAPPEEIIKTLGDKLPLAATEADAS
ncbi:MAG: PilZ domain-containing protein [Alphaproteobacteria bacterium]|nr:PilZ domain-containing protein [Alphaproteobacteria bacterium]